MWRSALDIARRAAALAGLILNLASMVLLILDPPLAVPAGIIAAGGVAFGTAVLGWAYLDARNERDAVQAKLDDRERVKAAQAEALKAFHDRLFEGTEVLRRILPWKRFPDDLSLDGRNAMEAERIALYTKLVSDWNEACLATAGTHLPIENGSCSGQLITHRPSKRRFPSRSCAYARRSARRSTASMDCNRN